MITNKKIKVVTFGEVMMRLSAPGSSRFRQADSFDLCFGGSEANVAAALAGFQIAAEHVTRFPENDWGMRATSFLRELGIQTQHVVYGPQRMGLYFLETGAMVRASRIIYDREDSAFAHITPGMVDWEMVFDDASWFHWTGITPAISAGAASALDEALEVASRKNIIVSADINYRRNLWQYGKSPLQVMPGLIERSNCLVAAVGDIENCTGIRADNFPAACDALEKTFPSVRKVVHTTRRSLSSSHNVMSATLWTRDGITESAEYDLVPIVDRVGTGDAFIAGLIYGWSTGRNDEEALNLGMASCAWKHSVHGDVLFASADEIESLAKGVNVGQLLR
jgi:2-dehydro-3-deoxygluconokinase